MLTTDYTRTNNPRSLFLAEAAIPFPEWLKGRPIPHGDHREFLSKAAFADSENCLLPVHEKEAAFYSAIDYFANADKYPDATFGVIKEAAEHFRIENDIAPYAEFFAKSFEKRAADAAPQVAEGRFAITTHLNGQDFRVLPINDAFEIEKSAKDLSRMVTDGRIHYLMFVDAAREIVKAANELKSPVEVHPLVAHVGEPRLADLDKAADMISSRRKLAVGFEGAWEAYAGAIKSAADGQITENECMTKIAAVDDVIGVRYRYDARAPIPLPHDIVFGGPPVAAVTKLASVRVLIRNVPVPIEAIRKVAPLDIRYHLTKEAAEDVLTAPDAPTLNEAVQKWASTDDQVALLRLVLSAE